MFNVPLKEVYLQETSSIFVFRLLFPLLRKVLCKFHMLLRVSNVAEVIKDGYPDVLICLNRNIDGPVYRRMIRLIEGNAKCLHLKKLT